MATQGKKESKTRLHFSSDLMFQVALNGFAARRRTPPKSAFMREMESVGGVIPFWKKHEIDTAAPSA